MNSSLASLASNLPKNQFKYLQKEFTDKSKFELMTQKGVYPYEYMDSFTKFDDTVLPPPSAFYSTLRLYSNYTSMV
jgi:hypothetical protein